MQRNGKDSFYFNAWVWFHSFSCSSFLIKDKQHVTTWCYTLKFVRQHFSASKFSRSLTRKCILQLHRAFMDLPRSQVIFLYSSGKFLQLFVPENTQEQIDTFLDTLPTCLIDDCSYFQRSDPGQIQTQGLASEMELPKQSLLPPSLQGNPDAGQVLPETVQPGLLTLPQKSFTKIVFPSRSAPWHIFGCNLLSLN